MDLVLRGSDVLRNDFHTHSVQSNCGTMTVMEIAHVAALKGCESVVISDHGDAAGRKMNFGVIANPVRMPGQLEFRDIGGSYHRVRLLAGIEANILDDGLTDLPEKAGRGSHRFHLISAGFHAYAKRLKKMRIPEANFRALKAFVENNPLDLLTHPCIDSFPLPIDDLVDLSLEHKFALEVNNTNLVVGKTNVPLLRTMIGVALEKGATLLCNSDGHTPLEINECGAVRAVTKEMGLDLEIVFPHNFCHFDQVPFLRG